MSDSFEFTLHSPLTKEDWDKISDVEYENTMSVIFQTPQGRQVRYIKCEVLDKIRAEIESNMESIVGKYDSSIPKAEMPSYKLERNSARKECIDIIDKHTSVTKMIDSQEGSDKE